jgi:hypothetical protein
MKEVISNVDSDTAFAVTHATDIMQKKWPEKSFTIYFHKILFLG